MKKTLVLISLAAMLFLGCFGDGSTGPSAMERHGWIVGENSGDLLSILHTSDGSTWDHQDSTLSMPGADLASVSAVDSTTAWAAGGLSGGYGVVIRTVDGGASWTRVGSAAELPSATMCITALDASVAILGGMDNSVLMTVDGGNSWQDISDPAFDGNFWQGIYALNMNDIWLSGGTTSDGLLIHTSNGGADWTAHCDSLLQGYTMISIAAWDQNNIWAVGHGFTIVRSTDGGGSWAIVTPDSMHAQGNDANGISLQAADDAWVVLDYGNLWRTSDGGENWTFQDVPDDVQGHYLLRVSALDGNTAWVTGRSAYGTQEGVILHTSNGGSNWVRQDEGDLPALWGVSFAGDLPN